MNEKEQKVDYVINSAFEDHTLNNSSIVSTPSTTQLRRKGS